MSVVNSYKEELQGEQQKTAPESHANRLLTQEIERLEKGDDRKVTKSVALIDVHQNQPQHSGLKVRIPVQEYPQYNFVGKLLGPKGSTLKRLQDETGCKMAIMGKGSIKDKSKEEELRKEGGKKYAHLNEELHVSVEVFAELTEAYKRLSHGVAELKKFLTPDYSDDFRQQQMPDMMYMSNGDGHGCRGGFRGARGGWGGPAFARHDSRRGGTAPHRTGAPPMRNGMPHRPAVVSPPSQSSGYEDNDYSSSSHGGSYDNYENGYSSRDYGDSDYVDEQADSQYYGGDSSGQITECGDYYSYRGYNNHRDSWNTSNSSCRPMKSSVQDRATKNRFQPYGGY